MNIMESYDWLWPGPCLSILCPWAQENFVFSVDIQPLDLSVNKSFKSKLHSTWERWMMTGVKDYTESGKSKRVSYEEISRWILESWQGVTVTCVKNGFQKAFGGTSMPEIEDHEESTSENELSDVPEKIINALHSFDCDSDEDFVGFE
jgi:hypothetical protein